MKIDDLDYRTKEFDVIRDAITHSAGFVVTLFDMIHVYGTEDPNVWEVVWESNVPGETNYETFDNALDAVIFFCKKRRELQLGMDIETELYSNENNPTTC